MIIRLICILGLLTLIGCSSDNGDSGVGLKGGGSGAVPPVVDDGVSPGAKVKWGQLSCQKSSNCENVSFNLSKEEWKDVFSKLKTKSFSDVGLSSSSSKEKGFLCGVKSLRILGDVDASFLSLSGKDKVNLVNFLDYVLNIEKCELKDDYSSKMDEYINL